MRLLLAAAVFTWVQYLVLMPAAHAEEAPHDSIASSYWASGIKQIFGTSYESYDRAKTGPRSRVWFTGAGGVLTEIFWPTIDNPQTRDSQLLITDGSSLFLEERHDLESHVEWVAEGAPAYRVTNSDREGRFTIEKTIFSDPDADAVIQRVRITRHVPGLRFFVLHNPSVANTPMGNSARVTADSLLAWQGDQAQSVVFSIPIRQASADFEGPNGGYDDVRNHFTLTHHFDTATQGNVILTAWLAIPETEGVTEYDEVLAFGTTTDAATAAARQTLAKNLPALLDKYIAQWKSYQDSVADLSGVARDGGHLFRASVAVLKSMEDKIHPGAFVASPTIPWGEHQEDRNFEVSAQHPRTQLTGGYHLVWPRDLYQMATTFLALKDLKTAASCLSFLRGAQYSAKDGDWVYGPRRHSKDGSFPQNMWVTGEPFWPGLQMDEAAMPVILAYRLWKAGAIALPEYWDMVRRASDFIQEYGPWSPMERWEEAFGASPSNIAAEITALWAASEMARQMQDQSRADRYRATADAWSSKPGDNVETWTFTTTGGIGSGRYYTRVTGSSAYDEAWDPNGENTFSLANGSGRWREKDVTDAGFLELVRFGVRRALDPAIAESIAAIDQTIRVDVPGVGPGFRRYLHDRYNYDDVSGTQTSGMLWPLLTGERAHYELERALENGKSIAQADDLVAPWIETMEKMATASFMLPEQVWDEGPLAGKPTGSATPLGWSHAEYVKLLRSRHDRKIFDRLSFGDRAR